MPKVRKCCVVGCEATSRTHRLYNFPKNDNLRELWLSQLVPVNVELSGLSKTQLLNRHVCQKHFDRDMLDSMGNRLFYGYPCLFTEKEILHGIPLCSAERDVNDHNYALQPTHFSSTDVQILEDPMLSTQSTIINAGDKSDHNYTSKYGTEVSSKATISYKSDGKSDLQSPEIMEIDFDHPISTLEPDSTDLIRIAEQSQSKKPPKRYFVKRGANQTTKCRCFIKRIKKMTIKENKLQRPFSERFDAAKKLSHSQLFIKNFSKMTHEAQDFLLMQLKTADKNKKAMRYTTNEKILSLSLMKESPKGYRLLRKIFNLPTKRTLNRLAENIKFDVGINENIFKLLKKKAQKWDNKKKLCSILFDEVALTPHLTYVESQDEIRGFKDFGNEREFKFCDHALVFMLKGVCSKWRQPISFYFCEGTTAAATVVRILKEVVAKVHESGLIPVAVVCDQGSTFRTAINMLKKETERKNNLNGEHNDGAVEISGQQLSVVYDPPHLLKSIRNNLLTKEMIFKGKIASWNDIKTVFNADCQLGHTRMNKKLTEHHVCAEKLKKMKVSVAAQALSGTTSAMLKYTALFKTTVEGENVSTTMATTGEAVEFMDQLFDSVNGSQRDTVKGKLRGPIKPKSKQLEFWQEAKVILKNVKFLDRTSQRARKSNNVYKVRVPCLDGWITTIESFERISKLLFEKYNIKYFYPRNINQDPLENFFGRIRAINYRNTNPDANMFINSFKSLLMSNVMGPHSIYANCEEDEGVTVIDYLKLITNSEKLQVAPDENKENIPPIALDLKNNRATTSSTQSINAANERLRVHSSAYTAGFICRKLTKKFNCKECSHTYVEKKRDVFHTWIEQREYKLLKNSKLTYPSKKFLLLYRDISGLIHEYLNRYAFKKSVKRHLKSEISKIHNLNWLGCLHHNEMVTDFFFNLILRLHIHNWCNIINKILRGGVQEKLVKQMCFPQKMAYEKYKAYRLRKKK